MSTRSHISVKVGNEYRTVYCHNDGDLGGVGQTLLTYYSSEQAIEKAVNGGSMSSLGKNCSETIYYKDRGEKGTEYKVSTERPNLKEDYLYIFENGKWYVESIYFSGLKELTQESIDSWLHEMNKIELEAEERYQECELERIRQSKEKEKLVMKETIEYLIRNGFAIKNNDGSKFDMNKLLYLHSILCEKNGGICDGKIEGEEIRLTVLDADHNDGFISFMPSNGFWYVIKDHSDHLSKYMHYVMCIMNTLANTSV